MNVKQMKKELGLRLKQFREAIGKTQLELAEELGVNQSSISNMEIGKIFPVPPHLDYFHHTYLLNINWLFSGKGEVFVESIEPPSPSTSLLPCHVSKKDPRYSRYVELIELMQFPEFETIILGKLVEVKVLFKDMISARQNLGITGITGIPPSAS